jgi:aryl-alcohol dehydrogenase-like predicted oxidoreductase
LQIEVIDLWQIHWPDPEEDIEEAWVKCLSLFKKAKCDTLVFPIFQWIKIKRIQSIHPIASNQRLIACYGEIELELL